MTAIHPLLRDELAAIIADSVPRPALRLVPTPRQQPGGMDAIEREGRIRVIRSMRRAYGHLGLGLIIDKATVGVASFCDLDDDALRRLHQSIDRAVECIRDDVTFEDAGLL